MLTIYRLNSLLLAYKDLRTAIMLCSCSFIPHFLCHTEQPRSFALSIRPWILSLLPALLFSFALSPGGLRVESKRQRKGKKEVGKDCICTSLLADRRIWPGTMGMEFTEDKDFSPQNQGWSGRVRCNSIYFLCMCTDHYRSITKSNLPGCKFAFCSHILEK